jgi:hypothetical protein
MALVPARLFFRGNRDYKVGTIVLDLILSEAHSFPNIVTPHRIEDGSVVTDHIKNDLINGSLTGLISNFTLKLGFLITNRAQDAFDEMERLWRSRQLVTIVTVMKVYESVAITNVSINRSDDTGEAIALNVAFQETKTVKLKTVEVDVDIKVRDMSNNQNRQAAPAVDVGRTVGT